MDSCECTHHMAIAMMSLGQADEIAAAAARGDKPEWLKRREEREAQYPSRSLPPSSEALLDEYMAEVEILQAECGLRLKHVYPFRNPDEKQAQENLHHWLEKTKAIARNAQYDGRQFDMLNEVLVVGSECWEKR